MVEQGCCLPKLGARTQRQVEGGRPEGDCPWIHMDSGERKLVFCCIPRNEPEGLGLLGEQREQRRSAHGLPGLLAQIFQIYLKCLMIFSMTQQVCSYSTAEYVLKIFL